MATIQQRIRDAFFAKLEKSDLVDSSKIKQLRNLMEDGKKLKADDLTKIFSAPASDGSI